MLFGFMPSAQADTKADRQATVTRTETRSDQQVLLQLDKQFSRAASWNCRERMDRNDVTFKNGMYVLFTLVYDHCYRATSYAKVRAKRAIVSYNMMGDRMTCNRWLRKIDGVSANWYFWRPYTGESFNPGGMSVICDESTRNSEIQFFNLEDSKWLEFGPGNGDDRQPRWRVGITQKRNGNEDLYKAYGQKFRPLQ